LGNSFFVYESNQHDKPKQA
jgi:hypothetical protein